MRGKLVSDIISGMLLVAVLVGALFFTGKPGALAGRHPPTHATLCLATDLPTGGLDAPLGKPVENAVNLAVMQNRNLGDGYTLKVMNCNDVSPQTGVHDPATGTQNVQQMVHNPVFWAWLAPSTVTWRRLRCPLPRTPGW
jgi:hypothetical protein